MKRLSPRLPAALRLGAALSLAFSLCPAAHAQVVVNDGWAEKTAGLEFYIEVPMIDNKSVTNYGVGGNITAESIINSVRYADSHPHIHHVVFKMDTGGGALFHAEAMEDAIEQHHDNTEYHIVVQNAISAGIWTAFSCDNIFMCKAGTLGGATAYYQLSSGETLVAGDIPFIASRLEITAERNGYPKQVIKPLMLMDSELHFHQVVDISVAVAVPDDRISDRASYAEFRGRRTRPGWWSPFRKKPRNLYNTGQAVCGARGCTRACMMSLEARGVLGNKFHKPFRRRKPWKVDWEAEPFAVQSPRADWVDPHEAD